MTEKLWYNQTTPNPCVKTLHTLRPLQKRRTSSNLRKPHHRLECASAALWTNNLSYPILTDRVGWGRIGYLSSITRNTSHPTQSYPTLPHLTTSYFVPHWIPSWLGWNPTSSYTGFFCHPTMSYLILPHLTTAYPVLPLSTRPYVVLYCHPTLASTPSYHI